MNLITFEKFIEMFNPEINKFDTKASFDGYMFETFGEEFDYVKDNQEKYKDIWTFIEEDGEMLIVYGLRKVNRLGYFITRNIPLNPNVVVEIKSQKSEDEKLEEKYEALKQELKEVEIQYVKLKRKEFLKEVMISKIITENEDLKKAIEKFAPVLAYPQIDILLYDGYRIWADSIIFKNKDGYEKALVINTDGDTDSIFFEDEDGNTFTDIFSDFCVSYDSVIAEEVEVVK